MLGDDPFERLKNLLIVILAFIFTSSYLIIVTLGLGFIGILLLLLAVFKLLGFH